jgi:hypothetical protein
MIEIAGGIQFCMCPLGRRKKKEWFALPLELAPLRDRNGNPMPDLPEARRARGYYEKLVPTLPDDEDLGTEAGQALARNLTGARSNLR